MTIRARWEKGCVSLKLLRQFFAALMLVAWLIAGAHMALEHGGDLTGACVTCTHCHEDESAPADEHHHHDLGAMPLGKTVAAQKVTLAVPVWTPLYEQHRTQFAALLRQAEIAQISTTAGDSPPDERAAGWLLVSQTALPVRGPSLA